MKRFWTALSVLAIAAAGAWYFKDRLPLDQISLSETICQHSTAGGDRNRRNDCKCKTAILPQWPARRTTGATAGRRAAQWRTTDRQHNFGQ